MLVKGWLTQMSGSAGGLTASHNRGGMYLRARTIPTDPGTPRQVTLRAIMSTLAVSWGTTLTQAQRDAWDTYAANVSVVNPVGDTVFLTGFNMYTRANIPRVQAGLPEVNDGPTLFNLGDFTPMTMTIAGGGSIVTIAYEDTDDWLDEDDSAAIVLVSREKSPTINFFKGPYRFADTIDGSSTLPPPSPAAITGPFAYTSGNKGFAQVRVSRADGRLSALQRLEAIAS